MIGRTARRVSREDALDHVLGYTCLNDVSARDIQFGDGQWVRGKSLDTFCPMGPAIVTTDELADPQGLAIRCIVGDEVLQEANTSQMYFSVAEIVSYCSEALHAGTWRCHRDRDPGRRRASSGSHRGSSTTVIAWWSRSSGWADSRTSAASNGSRWPHEPDGRAFPRHTTADDGPEHPSSRPKVLDMFAGGGAIPLEALRLGCEAHAVELNPVAHLIELCTVTYPQQFGSGLADDVELWGTRVLEATRTAVQDLYASLPTPGSENGKIVQIDDVGDRRCPRGG